jgi:hypothetical protein
MLLSRLRCPALSGIQGGRLRWPGTGTGVDPPTAQASPPDSFALGEQVGQETDRVRVVLPFDQ